MQSPQVWWIGTFSPKFDVNSFSGIWENDVYGRTTADDDEGRPRHDGSSSVQ